MKTIHVEIVQLTIHMREYSSLVLVSTEILSNKSTTVAQPKLKLVFLRRLKHHAKLDKERSMEKS